MTTRVEPFSSFAEASKDGLGGLYCARMAGIGLGCFLVLRGILQGAGLIHDMGAFTIFRAVYFIFFGAILALPWNRILEGDGWKKRFVAFTGLTVVFVFVLVFEALIDTIAMLELGRRGGVPAFQGTMIFIALMQPPVVFFQKRPHLFT